MFLVLPAVQVLVARIVNSKVAWPPPRRSVRHSNRTPARPAARGDSSTCCCGVLGVGTVDGKGLGGIGEDGHLGRLREAVRGCARRVSSAHKQRIYSQEAANRLGCDNHGGQRGGASTQAVNPTCAGRVEIERLAKLHFLAAAWLVVGRPLAPPGPWRDAVEQSQGARSRGRATPGRAVFRFFGSLGIPVAGDLFQYGSSAGVPLDCFSWASSIVQHLHRADTLR